MKTIFYKIECLTNLHVGSGDVNYNIIDNEVEKDPVTGYPIIHASGVKGALRDDMKNRGEQFLNKVFGFAGKGDTGNSGSHKFLDAYLISRPMRVCGSTKTASVSVVTIASVNQYLEKLSAFGMNHYGIDRIDAPDFGEYSFLTNAEENISIEGEKTGKLSGITLKQLFKLSDILGTTFAVVKDFNDYDLPVMARNYLEKGISKNLWYEEFVPHGSVFYFSVICHDDVENLEFSNVVQFGGNASIGCGFTKITALG